MGQDCQTDLMDSLGTPPTYEEALFSLGRAPTEADLGPQSPELHSSSLMPYDIEEDRDPDEIQEQQEGTLEQMEVEGQDITILRMKKTRWCTVTCKDLDS